MNTCLYRAMFAILLVVAAIFVVVPLVGYFRHPVYSWELSSPEFVQGGIEVLLLFAAFVALSFLRMKKALHIALLCVGIAIYLRLHAVELPFIFGVFWLEGMLATGTMVFRARNSLSIATVFSVRFALGICVWTLGALLLSVLHLASPGYLLLYSSLLFAVALLKSRTKPFVLTAFRYLTHRDWLIAVLSAYILVLVLVLFARSPSVVDFDSIWYGLRSRWVLAPHGSIFDRLNLVSLVYYYPKLFEQLTLPASFFADFSFIYAINICIYLACGLCALALVRQAGVRPRYGLLAVALTVSMPAMTTMALTAKPDLLVSYFLLLGSLFFVLAIRRGQPIWVFGSFASVLLGLSAKLTAIPFGGLLSVAALIALGLQLRSYGLRQIWAGTAVRKLIGPLSAASVAIFLAFCWRTYHLTGYPIIGDSLVTRIFDFFGCAPLYPVNVNHFYTVGSVNNNLAVLYDYLFKPTVLPSANFVWPGNAGAFLFTVGCLYAVTSKPRLFWVGVIVGLSPMVVAGCLLAITYGAYAGGDGNYYIFPVTLAALLGLGLMWQSGRRARFAAYCVVPVFIAANSSLGFLLSPGAQHPGTAPFSMHLTRPPAFARQEHEAQLKAQGLLPIAQFAVENLGTDCRALAAGNWQAVYMLPCTLENFGENQKNSKIFESETTAVDYLNFAKINLLISPKFPADTVFFKTALYLRGQGAPIIETPTYFAIDLRSIAGKILRPSPDVQTATSTHVDLVDSAPTASAGDLRVAGKSRQGLFGPVPRSYGFYTEETPALFMDVDSAIRFPVNKAGLPASWVFSATVGFRPDDAVAGAAPVDFDVRILDADGRALAVKSWRLSSGEYSPVRVDFHATAASTPMYIELRCRGATAVNSDQSQIFIGQPEILYN